MFNIENFLLHCTGVDKYFSKVLPKNEIIRLTSIGKSIVITTIFSLVSSFYAVYLISNSNLISVLSSVIWAAFIYSLDRYMISSMLEASNKIQELKLFIPRFFLAIAISTTISVPISLVIFKGEITEFLKTSERSLIHKELKNIDSRNILEITPISKTNSELSKRIFYLNQQVDSCNKDLSKALSAYFCEIEGSCGSNLKGNGFFAKEKHNIYTDLKIKCLSIENKNTKTVNSTINLIQKNTLLIEGVNKKYTNFKENRISEIKENTSYSLMASISALSNLSEINRSMNISIYFINILIFFMNVAPIIFKVLSKRGLYEKYISDVNVISDRIFKRHLVNSSKKSSINIESKRNIFSEIKAELPSLDIKERP